MILAAECFLSETESEILLHIARDSMCDCVTHELRRPLDDYELTPALREWHGVFVMLKCAGHQRGTTGTVIGHGPLAASVQCYAVEATLHDAQFRPVAPNEIEDIDLRLAIIRNGEGADAAFSEVHALDDIEVGLDGLYIEESGTRRHAMILPQVAAEHHWDADHFLNALCRKAGVPRHGLTLPEARIYRFRPQLCGARHHSDYENW